VPPSLAVIVRHQIVGECSRNRDKTISLAFRLIVQAEMQVKNLANRISRIPCARQVRTGSNTIAGFYGDRAKYA